MKPSARLLGCGLVDAVGVAGTRGVQATWAELECAPPGSARTLKALFGKADATFRRIDLPAKALVLACEACGVEQLLDGAARNEAAVCVETDVGSLTTDADFQLSLQDEVVHAGIFPYSLTSTSLGEVALRYRLRGPTVSMSVLENHPGEALREALRMLAAGDVPFVVTGVVDAMREPAAGRDAIVRAVVAVLAPEHGPGDDLGRVEWPEPGADPYAAFSARCR